MPKQFFEVFTLGNGLHTIKYRGGRSFDNNDLPVFDSDVTFNVTFKTVEQAKEYASNWLRNNRKDAKSELFSVEIEDAPA